MTETSASPKATFEKLYLSSATNLDLCASVGAHFTLETTLEQRSKIVSPAIAMIDSGATGSFISESFARKHWLKTSLKRHPVALTVIDGRPIASGLVTHECRVNMRIGKHVEEIVLNVTNIGN